MANAYRYPKTSMGIILGTGTNAGKKNKRSDQKDENSHAQH